MHWPSQRPRSGRLLLAASLAFAAIAGACGRQEAQPTDDLAALRSMIKEGRYAEAQAEGRELLRRAEAAAGVVSLEVADVLDLLVEALWRGDQLGEDTFELSRRAVSIRETLQGRQHPGTATSLNHLGNALILAGRYSEARSAYERAHTIREEALGPTHPDTALVLGNLSQVEFVLGDLPAARSHLEQAIQTMESHYGPNHERVGNFMDNLGHVLVRQGDSELAAYYMRRSIEILEPILGSDHPSVLKAQWGLALALRHQGKPEEAIRLLERVADAQERILGETHGKFLSTAESLGNAYEVVGDFNKSLAWCERIVRIRKRAWPDHPLTAAAHHNYARFLYLKRDYLEAKRQFERALTLRKKWYGPHHFTLASTLPQLAQVEFELGNTETALACTLEAIEIAREQFLIVAAALSEKEALRLETARRRGIDAALHVLIESPLRADSATIGQIWDQVIASRALMLDEIARRKRAVAVSSDPAVREATEALSKARTALAELLVSSPSKDVETYQQRLHEAEENRARAERQLAALQPGTQIDPRAIGHEDVAHVLPEGAALVAYARYERSAPPPEGEPIVLEEVPLYLAFVLHRGALSVHALGTAEPIEAAIGDWKRLVGQRPPTVAFAARKAEADYAQAARRLRALLWDPLAPSVGDAEEVFIVPEAAVHLVSFSTLTRDDGTYLAEAGPAFHYLSTERDLVTKRDVRNTPGRGLFALGGPDFGPPQPRPTAPVGGGDCIGLAGISFEPLEPSRAEVEALAAAWKASAAKEDARVHVAVGADATERAVRTLASQHRVVHLATHGFFSEDLCPPPDTPDSSSDVSERLGLRVLRDPLILSGLAFAGANVSRDAGRPAEDDGILTAEEVASLDLSGVEWIVLSACKTGVGQVQSGEGVLGLRRAFETAGARTLIMSLWAVDDEATRAWMGSLYAERLSGRSTIASVQAATQQTIEHRRTSGRPTHPFYWGAFTAVGDWR